MTADVLERAGLVRAGEGAALSHLSAARRWQLGAPATDEVWITVPRSRHPRSAPGLRIVRSRHMSADVVRWVGGVPVLSPARTVADLALHLGEHRLAAVALAAIQRGLCTYEELVAWQHTLAGRPGSADLRRSLDEVDPAFESILSAEFAELARRGGLRLVPLLELQLPDGGRVLCDFADPASRIDFEVDGTAFHSGPEPVARDRSRDRRLLSAGWVTVRYGTADIRRRPRETLLDIHRQIARRRA